MGAPHDARLQLGILSHQLALERWTDAEVRRLARVLDANERDLVKRLGRLETATPLRRQRLQTLFGDLRQLNSRAYARLGEALTASLRTLAAYEATFGQRLFDAVLPRAKRTSLLPSPSQLRAIVEELPLVGSTLPKELSKLARARFQRVQGMVRLGLAQSETNAQIVRRIVEGKKLGKVQAEALVRTAANHVSAQSREMVYAGHEDILAGVEWVATLDGRVTPICRALDGKIFKVNEGPRPPAHFRCLRGDALVSPVGRVAGVTKRWVETQLVVFRTASGHELACTPNHPVLTDQGWVPADLLHVGSRVVCVRGGEWPPAPIDDQHQETPTRIEDLARSALESGKMIAVEVPAAAEDFHGDGASSEVYVVAVNRELGNGIDPALPEQLRQLALDRRDVPRPALAGCGDLADLLFGERLASHRGVSAVEHAVPSRVVGSLPPEAHGAGRATGGDPGLAEDSLYRCWRDAEGIRERLDSGSGEVLLDDVVSIEVEAFRGHVFNLLTSSGVYVSNGIVSHNCRSATVPVTKSWEELGFGPDLPETLPPGVRLRPFVRDTRPVARIPKAERVGRIGQVRAEVHYSEWLAAQPPNFQDTVLGPKRGAIFRANPGMDLAKLMRTTYEPLTLAELAKVDGLIVEAVASPDLRRTEPWDALDLEFPYALNDVDERFRELWARRFGDEDPVEFVRTMLGGKSLIPESIDLYSISQERGEAFGLWARSQRAGHEFHLREAFYSVEPGGFRRVELIRLEIEPQGQGIGRVVMGRQVEWLERNGFSRIDLKSGKEVGAYAWARYGFLPTRESWSELRSLVRERMSRLGLQDDDARLVRRFLGEPDQQGLWDLADLRTPVAWRGREETLGFALLEGLNWEGTLNFGDAAQMRRFWAYVRSASVKRTP